MFDTSTVQLDWQGLNLKLETGLVARQADGAVVATLGSTSVLCTVCASKNSDPTIDFFPPSLYIISKKLMLLEKYLGDFSKEKEDHQRLRSLTRGLLIDL